MSSETIEQSDQGSRTMPDFVKRGLIRVQGGLLYLKAPYRVLWMREEHPDWAILSEVVYADYEKGFAVVKATVLDGGGNILAMAHSEESRGKLPYIKKAETGAIARALALCGYGTIFGEIDEDSLADGPTADPMAAGRTANGNGTGRGSLGPGEPGMLANTLNAGPGACGSCKAPEGKKHATSCRG
ncbi:MAG: hypothetical protein JWN14_25 [Chthonomonadales bacterium]|nr:hypothetical protein [Chthonomonadales bacterium]